MNELKIKFMIKMHNLYKPCAPVMFYKGTENIDKKKSWTVYILDLKRKAT
jgi:hypothetical protein